MWFNGGGVAGDGAEIPSAGQRCLPRRLALIVFCSPEALSCGEKVFGCTLWLGPHDDGERDQASGMRAYGRA